MWLNVYCDNTCSELILWAGSYFEKKLMYCPLDDWHRPLMMMIFETGFVVVVIKTFVRLKVRESHKSSSGSASKVFSSKQITACKVQMNFYSLFHPQLHTELSSEGYWFLSSDDNLKTNEENCIFWGQQVLFHLLNFFFVYFVYFAVMQTFLMKTERWLRWFIVSLHCFKDWLCKSICN